MGKANTIYLQRNEDGAWTSLEKCYHEHAKDLSWGDEGDGGASAADLALSILQWALETDGFNDDWTVKCRDGSEVYAFAYVMHHDFKRQIIAALPPEGGKITLSQVMDWVNGFPQLPPIH